MTHFVMLRLLGECLPPVEFTPHRSDIAVLQMRWHYSIVVVVDDEDDEDDDVNGYRISESITE